MSGGGAELVWVIYHLRNNDIYIHIIAVFSQLYDQGLVLYNRG